MSDTTNYSPMNLKEIAARYHTSVKTLKKWMNEFCPEIVQAKGCKTFTPDQVTKIINAVGEFPNT